MSETPETPLLTQLPPMPGLTEGRIVHYVLPDGPHAGEHRPAIIVKIWDRHRGYANLQVFIDGGNDIAWPISEHIPGTQWATSVEFSEEPRPRTWHWIEPA